MGHGGVLKAKGFIEQGLRTGILWRSMEGCGGSWNRNMVGAPNRNTMEGTEGCRGGTQRGIEQGCHGTCCSELPI